MPARSDLPALFRQAVRLLRVVRLCLLSLVLAAPPALAQLAPIPPPLDLPGERPAEVPIPTAGETTRPPVDVVEPPSETRPPAPLRVAVREIRVHGNTRLGDAVLRELSAAYLDRDLDSDDLQSLRDDLTRAYVERGYVTSGALFPDQDFAGGVLVVQIIEGRLTGVRVEGNRRLRDRYIASRLAPDLGEPVNVDRIEQRLQWLQNDPLVETVHAELAPGLHRGDSTLSVRIVERRSYDFGADVSNDVSPAIGSTNGSLRAGVRSLTGWNDRTSVWGRFSAGLRDVRVQTAAPVTRFDTEVGLHFRYADSDVVESPFDVLDIESDFIGGGLSLMQPVRIGLADELRFGLVLEWRRSRNFIGGVGFSFGEGADQGESVVMPLRFVQEWVRRGSAHAIALRSIVSVGLPGAGVTDVPDAVADGEFLSWIAQGQWAQRFDRALGIEVVARGDLQLSNDPLLTLEQFSVGGHDSVRGYREHQVVTDNGFALSGELRLPVWRRPDGRPRVQLATFADVGRGWDDGRRDDPFAQTLASVGLGLRIFPTDWMNGQVYWGHRLVDVPNPESDPQDDGVYFRFSVVGF